MDVSNSLKKSATPSVADARASFRRRSIDSTHHIALGLSLASIQQQLQDQSTITVKQQQQQSSSRRISLEEQQQEGDKESTTSARPQDHVLLFFFRSRVRHIQTLVSLALFSYIGEFVRYVTEVVFGLACHNPGTVGWNTNQWMPCTTAPGTTLDDFGGALFIDLPANVIGCFFMGLLVSSDQEQISVSVVNLPMACLPRSHFLQRWTMTHVGLRTGFCGALTTFASWNTQMIIMMCGGGSTAATDIGRSQWVSVLWGYAIGLFVALQAYQMGRDCAYALSRANNKQLAQEADTIMDKREIGYLVNRDLPDFERRFLHDIVLLEEEEELEEEEDADGGGAAVVQEEDNEAAAASSERELSNKPHHYNHKQLRKYGNCYYFDGINTNNKNNNETTAAPIHYGEHLHHLEQWKAGTRPHRRVAADYAQELQEIENALLVNHEEPRQELLEIARDAGWDVDALRNWSHAINTATASNEEEPLDAAVEEAFWNKTKGALLFSSSWEVIVNGVLLVVCTGLLLWGAIHFDDDNDTVSINYRAQFISALLAPFGSITRWYLSRLNGCIRAPRWEWLPIGTLLANLSASMLSAAMAAISTTTNNTTLGLVFASAVKSGYAGSLSTVSTFAAETVGLFRALPRYYWGYYYSFGSLLLAHILGIVCYVWAVV